MRKRFCVARTRSAEGGGGLVVDLVVLPGLEGELLNLATGVNVVAAVDVAGAGVDADVLEDGAEAAAGAAELFDELPWQW